MALLSVPPPLQRKKMLARSAAAILLDLSNQPEPKRRRSELSVATTQQKATKKVTPSRVAMVVASCGLEELPSELFGQVLSFVGPTSSSLVSLCRVNRSLHKRMEKTSQTMLPKATLHFRVPLPRMENESLTSLFLRHTRACLRVVEEIKNLRSLVNKDFDTVSAEDTQHAMDTAMALLQVAPTLSQPLEKLVLTACGKCGGMAFKLNKRALLASMAQRTTDSSLTGLQERRTSLVKHEERLDLSRLLMQMVLFRKFQLSRDILAPTWMTQGVPRHAIVQND